MAVLVVPAASAEPAPFDDDDEEFWLEGRRNICQGEAKQTNQSYFIH